MNPFSRIQVLGISFDSEKLEYYQFDSRTQHTYREGKLVLPSNLISYDGQITNPTLFTEIIKNLVKRNKLASNIAVCLPLRLVDLRKVRLPYMPYKELASIIHDEAERESIISISGEEIVVAHQIIGQVAEDKVKKIDVLMATIPKKLYTVIFDCIENADLNLISMEISIFSTLRALDYYRLPLDVPQVILNVCANECEMLIWEDGMPQFWRSIDYGSLQPDGLKDEVTRSIERYKSRIRPDGRLKVINWLGEGIGFEKIDGIPVVVRYQPQETRMPLEGLVLPWEYTKIDLNFMNLSVLRNFDLLNRFLLPLTCVLFLFILFSTYFLVNKLSIINSEIGEKKDQISRIEQTTNFEVIKRNHELKTLADFLTTKTSEIKDRRFSSSNLLDVISKSTPRDVQLNRLIIDEQDNLQLIGNTLSEKGVTDFVEVLSHQSIFGKVTLLSIQSNSNRLDFRIQCVLQ